MGEADMQGKDTSPVVTEAVEAEASTPAPAPTAAPADGVLGDTEVAKGMISQQNILRVKQKDFVKKPMLSMMTYAQSEDVLKKETAEA